MQNNTEHNVSDDLSRSQTEHDLNGDEYYLADGDVLVSVTAEAIEQYSNEMRDEVGIIIALSNNIMGTIFDVDGNVREGIDIIEWINVSFLAVVESSADDVEAKLRFKRALTTAAYVTNMEIPHKYYVIDHHSNTAIRALVAGQQRAKAMIAATKESHAAAAGEIKQVFADAHDAAFNTLK